jgi:hypothetical protein
MWWEKEAVGHGYDYKKEKIMNNVLNALKDSYINNTPLDATKFSPQEWKEFGETFDFYDVYGDIRPGFESLNPSKEEIFDLLHDALPYYEFDEEVICSFGNLSLALMANTNGDIRISDYIRKNKIKFNEFVRFEEKSIEVLPISELKFSDVEYHFHGEFESWETDTSIFVGDSLVKLCDYLEVKVEPLSESPKDWHIPEYEFEEFDGDLDDFARLFSKPIDQWYGKKYYSK